MLKAVLGIDIGGSTTKIAGFRGKEQIGAVQVRASDQTTSLYGALGKFLREYNAELGEIEKIVLTGVGASAFNEDIYGIPTEKTDEFQAIGNGGLMLSGLKEAIVVSVGTGTAFVRAVNGENRHIGGSGVGGGTLVGLSSRLFGETDINYVSELAEMGTLENVDLLIGEITKNEIPNLPPDATAANFGSVKSRASKNDFALGLINMLFQTVGMLAVFACRNDSIKNVVVTGTTAMLPQGKEIFARMSSLYGIEFTVPHQAEFATAIGAAAPYLGGMETV